MIYIVVVPIFPFLLFRESNTHRNFLFRYKVVVPFTLNRRIGHPCFTPLPLFFFQSLLSSVSDSLFYPFKRFGLYIY